MGIRSALIVFVLIAAFYCTSDSSMAVQELYFFQLESSGNISRIEGKLSYALQTLPEGSFLDEKLDRVIDLQAKEIFKSNGTSEKIKILDTISHGDTKVRRYIYGMGQIDGLSIFGVDQDGQILFVINPSWKSGAASTDFLEKYKSGIYPESVLTLNLPKPPLPERFK